VLDLGNSKSGGLECVHNLSVMTKNVSGASAAATGQKLPHKQHDQ
jgi:hypothetical protein